MTAGGELFSNWCKNQQNFCSSSLIVYDQLFALTRSILINPKLAIGSQGGENIQDVLNRAENAEFYQFSKGFIQVPCSNVTSFEKMPIFGSGNNLAKWASSIEVYDIQQIASTCNSTGMISHVIDDFTIAVTRYDYANIYHTITDLYTVYILCRFFNRDPKETRILFVDGHPKGNLDNLWSTLFHSYKRLGQYRTSNQSMIFYQELIWSYQQSLSHLDVARGDVKERVYINEFRRHVLTSFNISIIDDSSPVNCDHVSIFLLLRKNYIAHPRNPTGKVSRQIGNEAQLLQELKRKLNESTLFANKIKFNSGSFETLSVHDQLNTVFNSDIVLGIHGAGLTHALFMKQNRVMIELYSRTADHFRLLAQAHNVNYLHCVITETEVSATTVAGCITQMFKLMCPQTVISLTTTISSSATTTTKHLTSSTTTFVTNLTNSTTTTPLSSNTTTTITSTTVSVKVNI
ncbi:unnamed protein product [Didymodactylos carnosus]|uniref:EGF domain-specific O-linked N-acetylglucosamine transferase n=1 Tax=Didymodactylos carnosus TaxID=1234261 RepID=A0A813VJT4_9BILA|nr:unnamed protein product [Didymodactylos carnosus]CAF0838623.1 unnamed protein product [Didymodactylos carnosus]CAF3561468.1 unnamed protein product [Didymodactylos carnosus]CAF3625791.1 unnamed protein product [Didymodactylos carnosus]